MFKKIAVASFILGAAVGPAWAQTPYAGLQTRPLKALSEQQIADLEAGRGMGYALAAELNGYPGPAHVLELADGLALSATQRAAVQRLFDDMKAEAVPLGKRLIAEETALDRAFAERRVTAAGLREATAAIGVTQAALREAHLRYHLATLDLLTPAQARRYAGLRGYGSAPNGHHGHSGAH